MPEHVHLLLVKFPHLKSEMWGTLITLITLMVRGAREDVGSRAFANLGHPASLVVQSAT
jgi:hypothetical protein